ncbi:right-handed parallel beta-helix repeat-containing protein [Seohaeicola saemankumensis]|nr:parallel beta-helix domain-containing protein [Seohaeicola saemankumensis]MCA0871548.1 right-handed parallel beta-helix repeat-containing protein [Seohaeicola saemankumensis]
MIRALAPLLAMLATPLAAATIDIAPGPDAEEQLQEALILAEPGDEIVLAPGTYTIANQLSLAVDDVTLRGAGMDASILSFKGQTGGSEGLLVTGNGAILQDFAVEDTSGDGIKSKGVDGIAMIRVRAEWTGGPKPENGAYGLYPVQSKNVLIDGAVAIGASDAGIYVGQSEHIIVRNSRAEFNVAGLEIENSFHADVHNNHLENNTGGILIFDLPDLPQQGGHHVRVFDNISTGNNTDNFAPPGNIVGIVPAGTGMLIMANSDVEVFGNRFENNKTVNLIFGSYVEETDDPIYNKHPRRVHIHHNSFGFGGQDPDDSEFGNVLRDVLGTPVPNIVFDGVMPLGRYLTLGIPRDERHSIHDNEHGGQPEYANADFIGYFGLTLLHRVTRSLKEHQADLQPLPAARVTIRGQDVTGVAF